ncbi:hypothetical protein DNX69_20260 [Rhodopseudomonas palustris]|uniref:Lipoprotein n=2 Tax=Rhodopseudomonas palustris TaxID=1076 RepID=A0A323UGV8_RHOPL|nr:hypothetical protein DNX69_20260 [Rhodopseudomonas palustris]
MAGKGGRTGPGRRTAVAVALVLVGCALGGCSVSLSDMPLLGSSETPAKPKQADAFPAVNDLPANRDEAVLAPSERNKIEQELIAARERQANANASATPPTATAAARTAASK